MIDYVLLGGKKRPLLYGGAAFKMMKSRTGATMQDFLTELSTGEPGAISDITFCALKVGEIAAKEPSDEDYNEMTVAVWIDLYDGGVMAFMNKIIDSLPKPEPGEGDSAPGEAQATGTGTN